uniref:Ara h 6 allergen n=3 Tax=Arachis TaxID=3817 RepID=A0A5Q0V3Y4_9FABA|nr:Ara h 6 allergen [Arachis rigonii]QGA89316.1 Ara h 6 allergen [Arachis appressipila]QGA89318.1 Ara h 6 allergen [Arachis dardani]
MAKSTILVALLALVLVAHASAMRREWGRQGDSSSCERQVDRVNLKPCEQHIMQRIMGDQEQYDSYDIRRSTRSSDQQQRCCDELNQMENTQRCMCEALQQIMENQCDRLQDRQMVQQFKRELMNLPQQCNFRAPQRCDLDVSGGRC